MELFNRFPRFNPLSGKKQHFIPPQDRGNYPAFALDFDILDDVLMPTFRKLDNEALVQQNRYRWTYIILISGGSLATILGIVQTAFQDAVWLGIAIAIVAAILVGTTTASRSFNSQERYMDKRLAAEKLRGAYFHFLGRYHPYEHDQDRVHHLRRYVKDIERKVRK